MWDESDTLIHPHSSQDLVEMKLNHFYRQIEYLAGGKLAPDTDPIQTSDKGLHGKILS
jgi:hypothetical protein